MNVIVAFILLFIFSTNAAFLRSLFEEWDEFKVNHSKSYESEHEEKFRFMVYLHNRHRIAKHNAMYEQGLVSFELGMNQFGDWSIEEYNERMNGFNRTRAWHLIDTYANIEGAAYVEPANIELPTSVDWRQQGAVTPVKHQGECGSCWAFSATGALEGQEFRHNGKLVSLSEQNLVDCTTQYGNHGCHGGFMHLAFAYIQKNHGIDVEQAYPYEGREGSCRYNPSNKGADDAGFATIPRGNEAKLQSAVATVGPVSVAIDASSQSFAYYKGGIFNDPNCRGSNLNHAVLVVGYGTDQGQDYWLLKNSWGTTWGEDGYMRIARNKDNYCGIANYATYPLVK